MALQALDYRTRLMLSLQLSTRQALEMIWWGHGDLIIMLRCMECSLADPRMNDLWKGGRQSQSYSNYKGSVPHSKGRYFIRKRVMIDQISKSTNELQNSVGPILFCAGVAFILGPLPKMQSFHHLGSVVQSLKSCPTLWNPMDCSMSGFPVIRHLLAFAKTHVHWVGDAIQPFHPVWWPSPPAFNLSQHQGLSNELALLTRWPQYWNFSISLCSEYSVLISFRIDWFDLLAVQHLLMYLFKV